MHESLFDHTQADDTQVDYEPLPVEATPPVSPAALETTPPTLATLPASPAAIGVTPHATPSEIQGVWQTANDAGPH